MSGTMTAYAMVEPDAPLRREDRDIPTPDPGEVTLAVAGCGVCHTDISFHGGHVRTNQPPPLVLGHEVAGTVVATGEGCEALQGKEVVVPAVLPCGECALCSGGRANACRAQKMPGNDIDGGFSTHMRVPARWLAPVGPRQPDLPLWEFSVVADAVTTPYQAIRRSGLKGGDVAIFVGLGGVGGFGVQIAAALGATVFGIDVDPARIEALRAHGLSEGYDARESDSRTLRKQIRAACAERDLPSLGWKVFETSGTAAGQETAFGLLTHAGVLSVVGFTPEKVPLRLSNLMAFDATAQGNWGCDPALYPEVLDLVARGQVRIRPFVEPRPLDEVNDVLAQMTSHSLTRRAILIPPAT